GGACVTPDGKWVLYLSTEKAGDPEVLMRIPAVGGTSRLVSNVRPNAQILCARNPSQLCTIAEPTNDHRALVVTGLDPVRGRVGELTRFALDPKEKAWFLDLSPDGTRIAAIRGPA